MMSFSDVLENFLMRIFIVYFPLEGVCLLLSLFGNMHSNYSILRCLLQCLFHNQLITD